MSMKIEGDKAKIYDQKGNLICERNATYEDLVNYIINTITTQMKFEITIDPTTGKGSIIITRASSA